MRLRDERVLPGVIIDAHGPTGARARWSTMSPTHTRRRHARAAAGAPLLQRSRGASSDQGGDARLPGVLAADVPPRRGILPGRWIRWRTDRPGPAAGVAASRRHGPSTEESNAWPAPTGAARLAWRARPIAVRFPILSSVVSITGAAAPPGGVSGRQRGESSVHPRFHVEPNSASPLAGCRHGDGNDHARMTRSTNGGRRGDGHSLRVRPTTPRCGARDREFVTASSRRRMFRDEQWARLEP